MVESREKHKVKICDFGLAALHCSLAELTTACGSRNYGILFLHVVFLAAVFYLSIYFFNV